MARRDSEPAQASSVATPMCATCATPVASSSPVAIERTSVDSSVCTSSTASQCSGMEVADKAIQANRRRRVHSTASQADLPMAQSQAEQDAAKELRSLRRQLRDERGRNRELQRAAGEAEQRCTELEGEAQTHKESITNLRRTVASLRGRVQSNETTRKQLQDEVPPCSCSKPPPLPHTLTALPHRLTPPRRACRRPRTAVRHWRPSLTRHHVTLGQ